MSQTDEAWALAQDAADPLRHLGSRFAYPASEDGTRRIYFCGNSLGLMPVAAATMLAEELEDWKRHAVEAHFAARRPWYSYAERCKAPLARIVGARPSEVVAMNSLTVNLHLLMVSFYRPTASRWKILIEESAFPSDTYAVATHVASRGFDAELGVIKIGPRPGERLLREEDIESLLAERGREIALVLLPGVQYFTGQALDVRRITAAAHGAGCVAGFDLAHAIGNVPLALHDWDVDFAVWCSYKYLNAGPGAAGGCYVHDRLGSQRGLPRMAGWWGNDPATRFEMDRQTEFVPVPGADGWQLSNPAIFAMTPLLASLDVFDEATMPALRAKSEKLTGYLEALLKQLPTGSVEIITPAEPAARGCQLSLRVPSGASDWVRALQERHVTVDFRPPDVIRVAPTPSYNTFHDVWRFWRIVDTMRRS